MRLKNRLTVLTGILCIITGVLALTASADTNKAEKATPPASATVPLSKRCIL